MALDLGPDSAIPLGVDAVRYSFIVMDLHHLLLTGLPAHSGVPQLADFIWVHRHVSNVQQETHAPQQTASLFDHARASLFRSSGSASSPPSPLLGFSVGHLVGDLGEQF